MKKLGPNWLTEKHIDFEYKKYILLAYFSEVDKNFDAYRLYPVFAELIDHYKQLLAVKNNSKDLFENFPGRLKAVDLKKIDLIYEKIVEDDNLMQELEAIINYSLPKFQHYLNEGKEIYDLIEQHLYISPIGVMPLNSTEGYFLLKHTDQRKTDAYQYQITVFERSDENYKGIHAKYIKTYTSSITNTPESIKSDLIRSYQMMPNPAAWMIESEMEIPVKEAFLPIAKRVLVKYVSKEA